MKWHDTFPPQMDPGQGPVPGQQPKPICLPILTLDAGGDLLPHSNGYKAGRRQAILSLSPISKAHTPQLWRHCRPHQSQLKDYQPGPQQSLQTPGQAPVKTPTGITPSKVIKSVQWVKMVLGLGPGEEKGKTAAKDDGDEQEVPAKASQTSGAQDLDSDFYHSLDSETDIGEDSTPQTPTSPMEDWE